MAAVRKTGYALGYASESLRDDREVVETAVKQDWWALQLASERLRRDRKVFTSVSPIEKRSRQNASEGFSGAKRGRRRRRVRG